MMESDKMETPPSGGSSPANHRWNPTKEQITLLENLYKQGVRTPSAEQIQEITTRLQVYGHIEGKNVFYWFQNHKARQRQKQKQDDHNNNMANFFTRFVHHHQPALSPFHSPPLSPNVICSSYFLPQSEIAFYPQCPKLLLPTNRKRAPRVDNVDKTNPNDGGLPGQLGLHATPPPPTTGSSNNIVVQETLPLFPLHPTGVLQEKTRRTLSLGSNSSETSVVTTPSGSLDTPPLSCISSFNEHVDAGAASHLFFDFFTGKGST